MIGLVPEDLWDLSKHSLTEWFRERSTTI